MLKIVIRKKYDHGSKYTIFRLIVYDLELSRLNNHCTEKNDRLTKNVRSQWSHKFTLRIKIEIAEDRLLLKKIWFIFSKWLYTLSKDRILSVMIVYFTELVYFTNLYNLQRSYTFNHTWLYDLRSNLIFTIVYDTE